MRLLLLLLSASFAGAQTVTYADTLAALNDSPTIALARLQLESARVSLEAASVPLSASLSAGYTLGTAGGNADPLTLSATLNVIPYGAQRDAYLRAVWNLEATSRALREQEAVARLEATGAYLRALRAGEGEEVALFALELSRTALEATQTRFVGGSATPLEVRDAELGLQAAENALQDARREREAALASLSLTLGFTVTEVAGEAEVRLPPLPPLSPLPQGALERRSDVQNAQGALLEAELALDIALRERLPQGSVRAGVSSSDGTGTLGLGASLDTRSYQPTLNLSYDPDGARAAGQTVTLALAVSIPLDPGTSQRIRAAEIALEQRRLLLETTLAGATIDVQMKETTLRRAEEMLRLREGQLERSRYVLETTRERYALGLIPPLTVQEALRSTLEAEASVRRARDAQHLAYLALVMALDPLEVP